MVGGRGGGVVVWFSGTFQYFAYCVYILSIDVSVLLAYIHVVRQSHLQQKLQICIQRYSYVVHIHIDIIQKLAFSLNQ